MPEPFRILVTGSRDWRQPERIAWELGLAIGAAHRPLAEVIIVHGGAGGADRMADRIARDHGHLTEIHPADWDGPCRDTCQPGHRKMVGYRDWCIAAGMYRNEAMVALGADLVLAFIRNGSHGATGCARLAEKAGIPVRRITSDG